MAQGAGDQDVAAGEGEREAHEHLRAAGRRRRSPPRASPRRRAQDVPFAVVGEGRGRLEKVVGHADVPAQHGQAFVEGFHVGVGDVGVVERLQVVELLLQVAQSLFADRVGDQVRVALVPFALRDVDEPGIFGEIQEGRGQVHHRLLGGGHLVVVTVMGQPAVRQIVVEALRRGSGLRQRDPQRPGSPEEVAGARHQDTAGELQGGGGRRYEVHLQGQEAVGGQEVQEVLQDVADVGEQLERRRRLTQRVPAPVVPDPVASSSSSSWVASESTSPSRGRVKHCRPGPLAPMKAASPNSSRLRRLIRLLNASEETSFVLPMATAPAACSL